LNTREQDIISESLNPWFCALAKRIPALANEKDALDCIEMAVALSKVDIPIEILTPAMNALASRVIEGEDRIPQGDVNRLAICAFANSNVHSDFLIKLVRLLMPRVLEEDRSYWGTREFIATARAFRRRDIPIEFRAQIMNMLALCIREERYYFNPADYVKIVELFVKSDIQSEIVREAVGVLKKKMLDRLYNAPYVIMHDWFEVQTYMAWVEYGISLTVITDAINAVVENIVRSRVFPSADEAAKTVTGFVRTVTAFVRSGIWSEEINQALIKLALHYNREVAELLPSDVCKELAQRISVLNGSEDRSTLLATSSSMLSILLEESSPSRSSIDSARSNDWIA
jgi:hypothetical protein